MKIASSVGVAGVSVISVPTTLSITSLNKANKFFQPLNTVVETINNHGKSSFEGMDSSLKQEYVQFGEKIVEGTKTGATQVKTKIESMSDSAKTGVEYVYGAKETINHTAFQLGDIIKAAIRHIPTIIKDSILEAASGGQGQHLLSIQKINDIVQSSKFNEFVSSLATVWTNHASLFSKMTYKDGDGIMQIFKELDRGGIDTFIDKVKENSGKLESTGNYCNATKLMMHLLIGKDQIDGIDTQINQLKGKLAELKGDLSKILESAGIKVDDIEAKLGQISDSSSKIKDPCSQS